MKKTTKKVVFLESYLEEKEEDIQENQRIRNELVKIKVSKNINEIITTLNIYLKYFLE